MSTNLELEDEACASFGIAAVDDVKLKCVIMAAISCIIAAMVARKIKRRSTDIALFTQPDSSHLGECPICCLPLSLQPKKSTFMECCSKLFCDGCERANKKREREQGLEHRCAFCREPLSDKQEEVDKKHKERVRKNDPAAMTEMGKTHYHEGDYGKALEYFTKAAELGDVAAHCSLGNLYFEGKGVEKDMKKAVYHWEQAAIGGHPGARGYLATHEMENDRFERAAKHFVINANLGCDISVNWMKDLFVQGIVSKEEYAAARRGYQAAVNEAKSAERDEGEAARQRKALRAEREKAEAL